MGRIKPDEMENYVNTSSEWLKLPDDGDVATVQFLAKNINDLDVFVAHKVKVNGRDRWVNCTRNYDDPIDSCPFCAAGIPQKPVMILSMYDHKDGKVKIWERGNNFRKILESKFNRYPGDFSKNVFDIERHGAKGDQHTTYELIHVDDEPKDLSTIEKPDVFGRLILDKTPDEMMYYLDHGDFPNNENTSGEVTRRAPSRRGY